jgi:hypothetical protein
MAAAIGVQYLRQVVITWSMRRRGSVQRIHIITSTPSVALPSRFARPSSRTR